MAWYLARPEGFARSLSRTVAELVKERYQGARQRRRDIRPRVHRGWTFAILRAISNGVLRDLNTAVVCEEMLRGTGAVYVDYVDYDEVAHHAGMFRPESLAALEAVDAVLGSLEQVAAVAPRRYWIVLVSDHGQSQGATFADQHGEDLAALCASLTGESVDGVEEPVESWGRAGALLEDMYPEEREPIRGHPCGAQCASPGRGEHARRHRRGPGRPRIGEPGTDLRAGRRCA